jgi:23S rRNA (guanine745-N1)-methyltransferase
MRILDAGCGECWYTAYFAQALVAFAPQIAGVDISKDALRYGAKRGNMELAVASTAHLPVASGSCDAVLNIFSPPEIDEFRRVLRPGGILIRALPLERHLWALKSALYDTPYLNPAPETALPGFILESRTDLQYAIPLDSNADIWNLFTMTPYFYKTGQADQAKLQNLTHLTETVEIAVLTYSKV